MVSIATYSAAPVASASHAGKLRVGLPTRIQALLSEQCHRVAFESHHHRKPCAAGLTWQEFLFALSFTSTREMGLNDYIGQYGIPYGDLIASSVMVSIPVILVFFFLQRQFVADPTAGSVKR
jgi:hypothetical protein